KRPGWRNTWMTRAMAGSTLGHAPGPGWPAPPLSAGGEGHCGPRRPVDSRPGGPAAGSGSPVRVLLRGEDRTVWDVELANQCRGRGLAGRWTGLGGPARRAGVVGRVAAGRERSGRVAGRGTRPAGTRGAGRAVERPQPGPRVRRPTVDGDR